LDIFSRYCSCDFQRHVGSASMAFEKLHRPFVFLCGGKLLKVPKFLRFPVFGFFFRE